MKNYIEELLMLNPDIKLSEVKSINGKSLEIKARNLLMQDEFNKLVEKDTKTNAIRTLANKYFLSFSRASKILYECS